MPGPEYHLPFPLAYSHCSANRQTIKLMKSHHKIKKKKTNNNKIAFICTIRQWLSMVQNCTNLIHSANVIGGGPIIVGRIERFARGCIIRICHRVIQLESHPTYILRAKPTNCVFVLNETVNTIKASSYLRAYLFPWSMSIRCNNKRAYQMKRIYRVELMSA